MSLYQMTKEAQEEATLTAITHLVVALRERSACDTFDIWEYDIFQEVDDDDPDLVVVRVCQPDYKKQQLEPEEKPMTLYPFTVPFLPALPPKL